PIEISRPIQKRFLERKTAAFTAPAGFVESRQGAPNPAGAFFQVVLQRAGAHRRGPYLRPSVLLIRDDLSVSDLFQRKVVTGVSSVVDPDRAHGADVLTADKPVVNAFDISAARHIGLF